MECCASGPTSPDIKKQVGWGDARDTQDPCWQVFIGCGDGAAGRIHRPSTGLSESSDPRAHHHQRGRLERHLHARARRRARQAHGHDLRHREPSRRHAEPRHPRVLEVAARRLHHLHHQRGSAGLQSVAAQEHAVQSGNGVAADRQSLPPDPYPGGQRRPEREDDRRSGRAVEVEARHAQLPHARRADGALHGDAAEGARRRLGAGAVPRRRRGRHRDPQRHDADRLVRRRQCRRTHPERRHDRRWR